MGQGQLPTAMRTHRKGKTPCNENTLQQGNRAKTAKEHTCTDTPTRTG